MNVNVSVRRTLCLLALWLTVGTPGQAAPDAVDPIVGRWFWRGDLSVTFKADGTCKLNDTSLEGTWQFLHNAEAERKYSLDWDHGRLLNKMIFSRDGRSAQVQDLTKGDHFVSRKSEDKPGS